MEVNILASGSDGNCVAVRSGQTTILIDAGIAKTKIEKRLLEVGIRPDEIAAIFVTHAHSDHIKGLPLAAKYLIPVYATYGEWKCIAEPEEKDGVVEVGKGPCFFDPNGFTVTAFKTYHDAYEPVGYTVTAGERKASICLDTGKVDPEMLETMAGSDIYVIEANHDPSMVEAGPYPDSVKSRILSDIGHLSNEQVAVTLGSLIQGRGERIYLTHLSKRNNLPALAEMTVKAALRRRGFEAGKHYEIEVV
ncbi:MBL fold metallo-hydrolase [Brevibacillus sp. B_LB10_24]|uniref:MBL fold metallo-hydrolase n=1 Tax=Brevibacillus sp. B_LB10_24 TaxID=3380645 RepID=UPI0038BAA01A